MATLAQLREGLAANLRTISSDVQVSPYVLAKPTPPAIDILPARVEYHRTFGNGLEHHTFLVQAYVASGLDEAAQRRLDEFVDSGVIRQALESDQTLGGIAQSLVVQELTEYGRVVVDNTEMMTARFQVLVYD
jgi:hypothetical protein